MACAQYLLKEKTKRGKFQIVLYHPLKKKRFVPANGSEIFVAGIPEDVNIWELAEFFDKAGDIFQLRLMVYEDFNKNRGFCYVTYMNSERAKKAVHDLEKIEFMGVRLRIESSMNNCRIFISGFSTSLTKDQIWLELKSKGFKNIVDVIMYRSYTNRALNRGFVFVEFMTHEQAANARAKFSNNNLKLFGKEVVVDWSVPVPEVEEEVMQKVKIIFMRNLEVAQAPESLRSVVAQYVHPSALLKVHKFKNYAFVHLSTRTVAEILMKQLKEHYRNTVVEIEWAKPPSRFTTPSYRLNKISTMNQRKDNCSNCCASLVRSDQSNSISPVDSTLRCNSTERFSDISTPVSSDEELQRFSSPRFENVLGQRLPLYTTSTPLLDDFDKITFHEVSQSSRTSTSSSSSTSKETVEQQLFYPRLQADHLEMGAFPVATPSLDYITRYNNSLGLLHHSALSGSNKIVKPRPIFGCSAGRPIDHNIIPPACCHSSFDTLDGITRLNFQLRDDPLHHYARRMAELCGREFEKTIFPFHFDDDFSSH